jgi:uncharacterized cupredoxin-like copper-binding protein
MIGVLGTAVAVAAIMAAVTAQAADWANAQTVEVVTKEYKFSPKRLKFERGVAYRLHIVNRGKEQHEFTAPEFFRAAEIADPAVLNRDRTEIEIPPGVTKDLEFVPLRAGRYPLRCSDHDWAGMTGEITVK